MPRLLLAAVAAALLTLAFATAANADCPGCNPTYKAPVTSVPTAPSDPTGDTTPDFVFGADLAGAYHQCRWGTETSPWNGDDAFSCPRNYTAGPLAQGTYFLYVRACKDYEDRDIGTIAACDQTPRRVRFTIDTSGPAAGFWQGPADGARLRTAPSYTFSGATNPFGPIYECAVDDAALHACAATITVVTTKLAQGEHRVRVRTVDDWGNWGPVAERRFVWDTVAPAVTVSGPGATQERTPTLTWTAPGDGGTQYATACTLDGQAHACANGTLMVTAPLADGEHTVVVAATDEAGNRGEGTATFTVDTVAPRVEGLAWDAQARHLTFTATDGATACRVGTGAFVACTSPFDGSRLAPGRHLVTVRATDAAGNSSAADLEITVPAAEPDRTGDPTTTGTTSDGGTPSTAGTPAPPAATPPAPGVAATPRQVTPVAARSTTKRAKVTKKRSAKRCTTKKAKGKQRKATRACRKAKRPKKTRRR